MSTSAVNSGGSMARTRRLILITSVAALTTAGLVQVGGPASAGGDLRNASATAGTRQYLMHPDEAPAGERARFSALNQRAHAAAARTRATGAANAVKLSGGVLFNRDALGLPQNETSVAVCRQGPRYVLGGTNDYRGIVDPGSNFTGWHLSADGGRSVANDGLLPPIAHSGGALPSGGDPVNRFGSGCSAYAADLNYDFSQGTGEIGGVPSGVGVYRSDARTLATCPRGSSPVDLVHPECWPTRRLVAQAAPGHFLDKEWMAVGRSGAAGEVVWLAYGDLSDFNADGNEESGVIKVVRCDPRLIHCTAPITLSGGQKVAEYPTITIARDGTTVVTWGEFFGESFLGPTQRPWMAVAPPGSTTFTRRPVAAPRNQIIRGREVPHAANFRFGTMFPSTVTVHGGGLRVDVLWAECLTHALDTVCEEPGILLTSSRDLGLTWSPPHLISAGGDNFMPTLATDPATGGVAAAWYTTRFDPLFHHRYDTELVRILDNGSVSGRTRVTKVSTEPDADPLLSGTFIGDYLEVAPLNGTAYVHFTANYRSVPLIGDGVPIPQQDNFLARVRGRTVPGHS
jgi:hypothetical protein